MVGHMGMGMLLGGYYVTYCVKSYCWGRSDDVLNFSTTLDNIHTDLWMANEGLWSQFKGIMLIGMSVQMEMENIE